MLTESAGEGCRRISGTGYPRVCFGVSPVDEISRSNETDSSVGQQGLTSSQLATLRQFVTALLKAAKDISFYPCNSPVIAQSLDQVISVLQNVVAMADPVVFGVQQNQCLVRGNRLLDDLGPEQRFATHLFGLGVRAMEIHSGTTVQEVHEFLNVISGADRAHMDFDLLTESMKQAGVSGITLYPAGRLDESRLTDGVVADEDSAVRPYAGTVEEDGDRVVRMLGEFAERLDASEEDAERLLEYVRETDCLADVADELDEQYGNESAKPLFDQLFGSIVDAARVAQRSPPSVCRDLLGELSKAVDTMGAEPRKAFVNDQLLSQPGTDMATSALLSRLNDETLADNLADILVLHGGTEAVVQTYFVNMLVSAERRNSIIELASKRVARQDDETEVAETVLRSISSDGTSGGSETGGDAESTDAEELPDIEELALTAEQRAEVERAAQTALDDVDWHNARTMLALLNNAHDPDAVASILSGLETQGSRHCD